ncbi:hypothetical protein GPJ56_010976 [Histomonas meleagridis]|uniref:uncharacterized protein n=1 Tax=Histomonas meleagridis TaxID=135588 RepID=UPI0035595D9D|nr:hypothetical protein GPJ56_010976 [Histomonas meleagridis]KAH0800753.1 hypothetical protein GO595_006506 [Histomonas meleagridis]
MSNNRNSDWKSIEAAITLRRSDFVNIILTSDKFTEPVNTSLVIFSKMLFYGRSMGSDVPKVVSKLSKDFFRFQSNSFLHNSVLALFQLFERKRFLTEELAKDFIDGLIEAFDTKHEQKYTCSYWGQAREIFDAVYPYVKQSEKTEKIESIKKIFDKEEKTIEEVTPIKISQKKPRRNVPTRFQKSLQINTHQQSVSKVTLFVLFLMTLLMAILFVRKITNLSIGE